MKLETALFAYFLKPYLLFGRGKKHIVNNKDRLESGVCICVVVVVMIDNGLRCRLELDGWEMDLHVRACRAVATPGKTKPSLEVTHF